MNVQQVPINRLTWERFAQMVKNFMASEVGGTAKWRFTVLITLLFAINGLNVVNSYVGRDFMTAIVDRDTGGFILQAVVYIGVFAASTVAAVYYRFAEERLGLLWREWLTRRAVTRYLDDRTYFRLDAAGEVPNPDQRIADDVRSLTVTTLSFVLMLLNAGFTVAAFSGVMWSISPLLFAVALAYAAGGSFLTVLLGRHLVGLNYTQLDKEANFRADLIHVRENAESVALLHREGRLKDRLLRHLYALVANFERIIAVNRNLGFFTTGYNYLIQIIPALIVAPMFIYGKVEFGVITQSAIAFAQLLGAFSLVVTQFPSISSYAAVIARLSALQDAIEKGRPPTAPAVIDVCEEAACQRVAYEALTLVSPRDRRILIKELSVSIPQGTRLLIRGPDDTAKVALFRATAGLWDFGEGRIVHPGLDELLFLPQRPYLSPGTLREVLLRTSPKRPIPDEEILAMLHALELDAVVARAGGLDVEKDWDDILSLGEQQCLAVARLILAGPRFAFLDRIGTTLSPEQVNQILSMLSEYSITYLALGNSDDPLALYDAVLQLEADGNWRLWSVQAGGIV